MLLDLEGIDNARDTKSKEEHLHLEKKLALLALSLSTCFCILSPNRL